MDQETHVSVECVYITCYTLTIATAKDCTDPNGVIEGGSTSISNWLMKPEMV